jgi:predicted flap endonuclease-1-like 5' DNA nuclease
MTNILEIEGVGEVFARKLAEAGATTIEKLLEMGATPKGRAYLVECTGISAALILQWVNHADLFRVKGIGSEFADLLEAAGVDTLPELAQRVPENLQAKLVEVNEAKKIVRQTPALTQVQSWVEQAKQLARVITY